MADCNSMDSGFCFIRLILPPMVHCNKISLDGLTRDNIEFQSLKPSLVLGIAE